jgi:preprotein translocase subunit YajC
MSQTFNMLMPLGIMAIFYFFILRPQSQKQNQQIGFLDKIAKGDTVGTASGMIGKISNIDGAIVTLEVDKNTYIKVTKTAISKEVTDSINKLG